MNITDSINNQFKAPSIKEWKDLVASQLKTDDIDKKIIFRSVEGIDVKALNTVAKFNYVLTSFPQTIDLLVYKKSSFKESVTRISNELDIQQFYSGKCDVNSSPLHNCGSSIVNELAYILESFEKESTKNHVDIEVSIDSQTYLNISKLRALRFMLDSFIKENSLSTTYSIIATTSLREQTFFDPWMNMLRAVSSLSASIMGGANSFAITSYDFAFCLANNETPNDLALRNAINMGKILIEESKLDLVKDSMHGSFAIENLTHEIVTSVISSLKSNVKNSNVLSSDFYKNEALNTFAKRLSLINRRKYIMSGINDFVNLEEDIVGIYNSNNIVFDIGDIDGYPVNRLAHDFENLRLKTSLRQIKLKLINVGELKSIAARSSFCKNYFEVAGVEVESIHLTSEEFKKYSFDVPFCICTTDDQLESILSNIDSDQKLKFIAGKGSQKEGFTNIYMGQDIFEVLSQFKGDL